MGISPFWFPPSSSSSACPLLQLVWGVSGLLDCWVDGWVPLWHLAQAWCTAHLQHHGPVEQEQSLLVPDLHLSCPATKMPLKTQHYRCQAWFSPHFLMGLSLIALPLAVISASDTGHCAGPVAAELAKLALDRTTSSRDSCCMLQEWAANQIAAEEGLGTDF